MNGLIVQWGKGGEGTLTLPLSYTSVNSYTVLSSPISNYDGNFWYSEGYRPSTANKIVRRSAYSVSWFTIGY